MRCRGCGSRCREFSLLNLNNFAQTSYHFTPGLFFTFSKQHRRPAPRIADKWQLSTMVSVVTSDNCEMVECWLLSIDNPQPHSRCWGWIWMKPLTLAVASDRREALCDSLTTIHRVKTNSSLWHRCRRRKQYMD